MPAFENVSGATLVGVVEPSAGVRAQLRERGYAGKLYEMTAQDFLALQHAADTFADAVIIATPNLWHEELCELALTKGFHVLCEKPLASTAEACERLAALARKQRRLLAVGMVRRFAGSVAALERALKMDSIGKILSVQVGDGVPYCWPAVSEAPFDPRNGGVLMDMGVHYLDLLQHLLGELTSKDYSDDWAGGCEANAEYRLQAKGKIPVTLKLSREHHLENTFLIRGERGTLFLMKSDFERAYWKDSADLGLEGVFSSTSQAPGEFLASTFEDCFVLQLRTFCEAVRGRGEFPSSAQDAAKTMGLIEWAYKQSRVRRKMKQKSYPGRVWVTGGTGFIGSHLTERLVSEGADVTVPVRNFSRCSFVSRFPVKLERWDLLNQKDTEKQLQGVQYVFHLAYSGRSGEELSQNVVEGTKKLVQAAVNAGVECVVVLSTMYVFGFPSSEQPVDESAPYRPYGAYGKAKADMEKWLLSFARHSKHTRIVVLNPSYVFGPRGGAYSRLPAELARDGQFAWVEGGRGTANYTYVENLIDAMLLSCRNPSAHGERFIISDGSCTWRDLLGPMLEGNFKSLSASEFKLLQKRSKGSWKDVIKAILVSREVRESARRLTALRAVGKFIAKLFPQLRAGKNQISKRAEVPPLSPPSWLHELYTTDRTCFSAAKAERVLNWKPRIPLSVGQKRTKEWLREARLLPSVVSSPRQSKKAA